MDRLTNRPIASLVPYRNDLPNLGFPGTCRAYNGSKGAPHWSFSSAGLSLLLKKHLISSTQYSFPPWGYYLTRDNSTVRTKLDLLMLAQLCWPLIADAYKLVKTTYCSSCRTGKTFSISSYTFLAWKLSCPMTMDWPTSTLSSGLGNKDDWRRDRVRYASNKRVFMARFTRLARFTGWQASRPTLRSELRLLYFTTPASTTCCSWNDLLGSS